MPAIGDMKIVYIKNGKTTEYKANSVDEAKHFINIMAQKDLTDDSVDYNLFDLLIYKPEDEMAYEDGWTRYHDENYLDINGYAL